MIAPTPYKILLVANKQSPQFNELQDYLDKYYDVDLIHTEQSCFETVRVFQPHLIIIDNRINDKTGLEVLKALRKYLKHHAMTIPKMLLIVQDAVEIDKALRAKVDDCLPHPFTHKLILQRVRYLLSDVEITLNFARRVFNTTFEGIAIFSKRDNRIIYANSRMLKILGKNKLAPDLTANTISQDDEERLKILEQIYRLKQSSPARLWVHLGKHHRPCFVRIEPYNSKMFIMFVEEVQSYQRQYEDLIDQFSPAMIVYRADDEMRRVFKINHAVETLLGYSRLDMQRLTRRQFVLTETKIIDDDDTSKPYIPEGSNYTRLATLKHKQGHTIEALTSTYSTVLNDEDVIVEFFEDVRPQQALTQQLSDFQQVFAMMAQAVNLDELFEATVSHLCEHMNATTVNCMLLDKQEAVVIQRKADVRSFNVGTIRTETLDISTSKTLQWMMTHKTALYIPDVRKDERWQSTSQEYWLKCYLGLPVIVKDQVIGFIGIDGAFVDQFSQQDIAHATTIVNQISKIIERDGFIQQPDQANGNSPAFSLLMMDSQKYLDKQLNEQLSLFQQLLDHVPVHIYIKNRHGRFVYMNKALADTIGTYFDTDTLVDITDAQLDWGEDFLRSCQLEREIFTSKQAIINDDVMFVNPNTGEKKHYLTTKTPIFQPDGEILYIAGIDREVTSLQRTLDHVVDSVNCILWYADIIYQDDHYNWTYNLFSEAAAQRLLPLDVSEETTYMMAWKYAIFEEDLIRIERIANNALATEKPTYHYEFRTTNKYGDVVWIHEDARITRLSATHWRIDYIAVDITERHNVMQELERLNEKLEARVKERTAALTHTNAQLQAEILYRQRVEDILREQERQYRTLTNQLPLGVYRVGLDGRFLYANDQFAHMFGYDHIDALFERNITDLYVNPQDRPGILASAQINPIKQQTNVLPFWHRNGQQIQVRASWRLIQSGEDSYIDGIMEDITQTLFVQEIERDQRQFVEALQNASTDLSRSLNLDQVIKVVLKHINHIMPKHQTAGVMLIENGDEVRSIAYQRQTADGPEVYPTNNTFKMRLLPTLVKMYEAKAPIAIPNTDIDPDWQYVEVTSWIKSYISSPIVVAGEVIGFINLSSDTANTFDFIHSQRLMAFAAQVGIAIQNARMYEAIQKHASELEKRVTERTAELEHKTLQLQTILDAMAEGVIYYNQDIQPQFSNRSLVAITGYSSFDLKHDAAFANLLQLSLDDFVHWRQDLMNTLAVTKVWQGEYQLKRKDGKLFDAYIGASHVHDEQENFYGFVMVIRDITQEKHLERQRINFITQASHQLRTPITNLKTYLYLIKRKPEETSKRLLVIEEVTEHLHQLVESLLEITKSASIEDHMRRFTIPIQAPVVEIVESLSDKITKHQLTLTTVIPQDPIYVSVDPGQIKDAFLRILDNAITATEAGGQLHISLAILDHQDRVSITFTDTGSGIPRHLIGDVFTPFIRGLDDFSGAGIGLSIVKHIINLHSGNIEIESTENEGTSVIVTLPIVIR